MQRLPRWPSQISPVRVVTAIVIVAAIIIGVLVATLPPAPVPPDVVQSGDFVEVSYIGFFTNGRVFDTSLQHVAEDNATWPKAASFEFRRFYSPLRFQVGSTTPTVIEGFEHGVLFPAPMRVGEAREVVVPPEMGYGSSDPLRIEVRPLREELTQFETFPRLDFIVQFQQEPTVGLTFVHPVWQWATRVVEASEDFVAVMHLAQEGFVLLVLQAWEARVLEVDTSANAGLGRIVVSHLLDTRHVDNLRAEDDQGSFRIVSVNSGAGTYTVDYNEEVVGQTLIFRMELISIERS